MEGNRDTFSFEVARWDLEIVCHELSASAKEFPLAWSALTAARDEARSRRGNPVTITLTRDAATRLVHWVDDHASLLTAQRMAKEAFSRFLGALAVVTPALRRPGKVISVPNSELPTEAEVLFKDVDLEGRVLTRVERGMMGRVLGHYSLDVDAPVWVIRPRDVRDCLRFTDRPDLDDFETP